jgi:hypothetical protein
MISSKVLSIFISIFFSSPFLPQFKLDGGLLLKDIVHNYEVIIDGRGCSGLDGVIENYLLAIRINLSISLSGFISMI